MTHDMQTAIDEAYEDEDIDGIKRQAISWPPGTDLGRELDRRCPPWQQHETSEFQGHQGITPHGQDCGKRTFILRFKGLADIDLDIRRDGRVQREFDMPFQPYVRAVDPSGNLVTLLVSTTRDTGSAEETGFRDVVLQRKRRSGWLIAEADEELNGRSGVEHLRFCFDEMVYRRRKHAAKMAREAAIFTPQLEKTLEAQGEMMAEQSARMTDVMEKQGELLQKIGAGVAQPGQSPAEIATAVILALREAGLIQVPAPAKAK